MPNPSSTSRPQALLVASQRNDVKVVLYLMQEMRHELEAHVAGGSSISSVVRRAVREYFRRHPLRTAPAVPSQRHDVVTVVYLTQGIRDELEARVNVTVDSSMARLIRQAVREYFRRHPRPVSA